MGNLIQFLMRLFGISQADIMEKVFKNVVLGGKKSTGTSTTTGGKNPLEDLMGQFKDKGLGNIFNSWVGKGANHLITPEQVQQGLGDEKIAEMAKESGLKPEQVTQKLSTLLPGMIDKMTPTGTIA